MAERAGTQLPALEDDCIALVFSYFPYNETVLAVKSLNRFWHGWATQQLMGNLSPPLRRAYIPLWALKKRGIWRLSSKLQDEVMGHFAAAGDWDGLRAMHKQLRRVPETVAMAAAYTGQFNVLTWAKAHGCAMEKTALVHAAGGSRLDVIQWLEETCDIDQTTMDAMQEFAADRGRLNVLSWARDKVGYTINASAISKAAAAGGHLAVFEWMREEGLGLSDCAACTAAARHGHLDVLMWLRETASANWDEQTTKQAAIGGHLQLLQWALEHRCPWDGKNLLHAACFGHVDVVQWQTELPVISRLLKGLRKDWTCLLATST